MEMATVADAAAQVSTEIMKNTMETQINQQKCIDPKEDIRNLYNSIELNRNQWKSLQTFQVLEMINQHQGQSFKINEHQ